MRMQPWIIPCEKKAHAKKSGFACCWLQMGSFETQEIRLLLFILARLMHKDIISFLEEENKKKVARSYRFHWKPFPLSTDFSPLTIRNPLRKIIHTGKRTLSVSPESTTVMRSSLIQIKGSSSNRTHCNNSSGTCWQECVWTAGEAGNFSRYYCRTLGGPLSQLMKHLAASLVLESVQPRLNQSAMKQSCPCAEVQCSMKILPSSYTAL